MVKQQGDRLLFPQTPTNSTEHNTINTAKHNYATVTDQPTSLSVRTFIVLVLSCDNYGLIYLMERESVLFDRPH